LKLMNKANEIKHSYHKQAIIFLKFHYQVNPENKILFNYHFSGELAKQAKLIGKSISLEAMDYENAIIAALFCYTGIAEIIMPSIDDKIKLLHEYFDYAYYPQSHRAIVENTIRLIDGKKVAYTSIEQVASDAVYSQLCHPHFIENINLQKDEVNGLFLLNKSELFYLQYYSHLFKTTRYYTGYAFEHYAEQRGKNLRLLEIKTSKMKELQRSIEHSTGKINSNTTLSNKETEDLFKLAFRNYNHLISVADSKASLLIHVNAIIISVMLAFVVRQLDKYVMLLGPAVLLLLVSLATIFLSILASRPQQSNNVQKKRSGNFQHFFFGSFDLIDPAFRHISWDEYHKQLEQLFSGAKEKVYLEMYKESYNVRKVLSRKFNFLSMAYWVFIIGLLVSLTAFVIAIRFQKITY
jgi:Family of unknown function (DUF5706)